MNRPFKFASVLAFEDYLGGFWGKLFLKLVGTTVPKKESKLCFLPGFQDQYRIKVEDSGKTLATAAIKDPEMWCTEINRPRPLESQRSEQSEASSDEEMIPDWRFCLRRQKGHRHATTQCGPATEEKASLARPWMCDRVTQTYGDEEPDCNVPPGLPLTSVATRPEERPIEEVFGEASGTRRGVYVKA